MKKIDTWLDIHRRFREMEEMAFPVEYKEEETVAAATTTVVRNY